MLITSLLFFISISLLLIFSKARHKIDTRKNLEKSRKIYEFFFCKFYLLIPKRRIKLDKTPSIHRPNFENMMGNLFLIYAAFSCFINKRTQYWMQGNTARQTTTPLVSIDIDAALAPALTFISCEISQWTW